MPQVNLNDFDVLDDTPNTIIDVATTAGEQVAEDVIKQKNFADQWMARLDAMAEKRLGPEAQSENAELNKVGQILGGAGLGALGAYLITRVKAGSLSAATQLYKLLAQQNKTAKIQEALSAANINHPADLYRALTFNNHAGNFIHNVDNLGMTLKGAAENAQQQVMAPIYKNAGDLMDIPIEPYTIHSPSGVSMTAFDLALDPHIDMRTFAKFAEKFDVPMTGNQADALYKAIRSNPGTAQDLNRSMSLNQLNAYKGSLTKGDEGLDRSVEPLFNFARDQRNAMLKEFAGLGPREAYQAQVLQTVGNTEAQTQRTRDILESIIAPGDDPKSATATQKVARALRSAYGRPLNATRPYQATIPGAVIGGVIGGTLPERPIGRLRRGEIQRED